MFVHLNGREPLLQHVQHWYYHLSHQDNVELSKSSEEIINCQLTSQRIKTQGI